MLVIKDRAGKPVDDKRQFAGKWHGSPDWSLYFPMTVRFTAVVVAKGARHNPNAVFWRIGKLHVRDLKHLKSVARSWLGGRLGSALKTAEGELGSEDAARAEEARKVVDALRTYAAERRKILESVKLAAPNATPMALGSLARRFSGSSLGKELSAEARAWSKDPALANARKALPLLAALRKAAAPLRGRGDASDPAVSRRFAREIRAIQGLAARLRKDYSETPSWTQASRLLDGLKIAVPE